MELIFATNNQNKVKELRTLSEGNLQIIALKEAGITEDLPEPFDTFQLNAQSKAEYVFKKTGKKCFAEDSGLVVPALNGAPGVFSARYAGQPSNDENNNQKLIRELKNKTDLSAWYQATICLFLGEKIRFFEGRCPGKISLTPEGKGGFGYDPLFIPEGYDKSFAVLPPSVKSSVSHRSQAFKLLVDFLIPLS